MSSLIKTMSDLKTAKIPHKRIIATCTGLVFALLAVIGTSILVLSRRDGGRGDITGADGGKEGVSPFSPTQAPVKFKFTTSPTTLDTESPTIYESNAPTSKPTTQSPTTAGPSKIPTTTGPTFAPSPRPTPGPTSAPSPRPTPIPSVQPTPKPTNPPPTRQPVVPDPTPGYFGTTVFHVVADVPYTTTEAIQLPGLIEGIPNDSEFLVHLGDLFHSSGNCRVEYYDRAVNILSKSKKPVFVVIGDNEWNDCPRDMIDTGYNRWSERFLKFENKWSHSFRVTRQNDALKTLENNFYFMNRGTLFIGLNIVGGFFHMTSEWYSRLDKQLEWIKQIIWRFRNQVGAVVLFGHANPTRNHDRLFIPLRSFLKDDLRGRMPFMYLHGDIHTWAVFYPSEGISNYLRISVEAGTREKPLRIEVNPKMYSLGAQSVFKWKRQKA